MKKTWAAMLAVALWGAGNAACAACAYLNVSGSGASLAPGGTSNVYGPFTVSCLGSAFFEFEDLSGNRPASVLDHLIEQRVGDAWVVVSSTRSRGARKVHHGFTPSAAGEYRYRIVNTGQSTVRSWRVHGRTPSITLRRKR